MDAKLVDYLSLARFPGVGPVTFFDLLRLHGSVERALDFVRRKKGKNWSICNERDIDKELNDTRRYGADIITFFDERYPVLLRNIHAPPPVLSVLGNVQALSDLSLGIVGSRNASINGVALAKIITKKLGEYKIYTVSGLASGIDSAVHTAAVENHLRTVAVLGSGLSVIYPRDNAKLYKLIIDGYGAIVSEFAFAERAKRENFPRRNRLISGMAHAVVVVEAGERSGSLITARFAVEQGREVFAVPGSPFDRNSSGTNRLIRDGAVMVTCIDDIVNNLGNLIVNNPGTPDICKYVAATEVINEGIISSLKGRVLAKLTTSGASIEQIASTLAIDLHCLSLVLVELEISGTIYRDLRNRVYLVPDKKQISLF